MLRGVGVVFLRSLRRWRPPRLEKNTLNFSGVLLLFSAGALVAAAAAGHLLFSLPVCTLLGSMPLEALITSSTCRSTAR